MTDFKRLLRPKTPQFVSVADAAQTFDLHEVTIRRYCRSGRLPAIRLNGVWRIPARALALSGGRL